MAFRAQAFELEIAPNQIPAEVYIATRDSLVAKCKLPQIPSLIPSSAFYSEEPSIKDGVISKYRIYFPRFSVRVFTQNNPFLKEEVILSVVFNGLNCS